tara:strand:- start:371 stop:577 length:207 start_codon:yes stop_codon:yes gene_type:complete
MREYKFVELGEFSEGIFFLPGEEIQEMDLKDTENYFKTLSKDGWIFHSISNLNRDRLENLAIFYKDTK